MYKKTKFYIKYIEPYEDILEQYSKEIGLNDTNKYIKLAEAFSRKAGEEVLWDIDSKVELKQKPVKTRYDIINYSGRSAVTVEVKCRAYSIDDFPTTDITAKKGDYISKRSGWIVVFFIESREYLVFDLDKYTPPISTWTHKKTTAYDSDEEITEDKYCFDPAKAIYRGKLDKNWITRGGYGREA